MFSIGLEFSLPQLYAMRKKVLGLGGGQVIITMAITMGVAKLSGLNWPASFVIGAALAMSSTAIVSKILAERIDLNSRHGRLSIGVLLFQDIAVVPMLELIPALGFANTSIINVLGLAMLKATAMLLLLFTIGKWLINPWFNLVASQRSRELFVMNVLMVTLLLAFATKTAGLSYALGAFILGMLISETKYRYQVESDISPFRDILLGLFFISVGMLLNLEQIFDNIELILLVLLAFILFKTAIVAIIVRVFKYETGVAIRTGVILAQAGEFSFVILALGVEHHLISGQTLQLVLAVSLLSMVIAPFLIQYNGRIARRLVSSYLNQFFAGLGGEEAAGAQPVRLEGAVGPGKGLGLEVAVTLACGDDYFGEHEEDALAQLLRWLDEEEPDVLVCGPSFGSGRYGYACGALAREAARRGVPAVCGMHPESPGVLAAEGAAYIVPTDVKVTGMRDALPRMAALARRLAAGEALGPPEEEGYLPRGLRRNEIADHTGARARRRAAARQAGGRRPHRGHGGVRRRCRRRRRSPTWRRRTLALVTESGLVPQGNPDRLESNRAHSWLRYPLDGLRRVRGRGLGDGARRLRHQHRERRPEPARAARRGARARRRGPHRRRCTRRSTRRPATRRRWRRRPSSGRRSRGVCATQASRR